jgi:hypothetical protein
MTSMTHLKISDPAWENLIDTCPEANIFHTPAWIDLISKTYNYEPKLVVNRSGDGQLSAGLPIIEIDQMIGGKRWVSLPFTDHCEILSQDEESKINLAKSLHQAVEDHKLENAEVRSDLSETLWHKGRSKFVLHTIRLDDNPDQVYTNLHSMHRRNIRKAESFGLRVHFGTTLEDIKQYYSLHLDTRRRQGTPIQPWRFFKLLHELVISKGLGFVVLMFDDQECVSGAVFLHWGSTLTYKYGASLLQAQESRANNLMMWHAIQWGCENGYKTLDMGRTDYYNKGLRSYKERWGAEEKELIYTTSKLSETDSRFSGLIDVAGEVIRRSPKWVCRISGELFYKYFA